MEVQWACRDSFGDDAWGHNDDGPQEDVNGGAPITFTVSVTAPKDLEAGVKCVALVVADEVRETQRGWVFFSILRGRCGWR